jgi:uroporphyrinogen-III synthase
MNKPKLEGVRVALTRAIHQADELARPLRALGADVILVPVIAIESIAHPEALRRAVAQCDEYDWIVFSSSNAVLAFVAELLPRTPRDCKARVAAVGEATRKAAELRGFQVALTPQQYVAEALVEAFPQHLHGQRVLIPSAAITRDVIAPALRKRGAKVEVVEIYRNVIPANAEDKARAAFQDPPQWVTFSSSSAVDNLVALIGPSPITRSKIATIGPITSATVRKHGLTVSAEANPHTSLGLVNAILSVEAQP